MSRGITMTAFESGTVKWFNDAKGYGFIAREDGNDVFVHYRSIHGDGFRKLLNGQHVEYRAVNSTRGLLAEEVRPM